MALKSCNKALACAYVVLTIFGCILVYNFCNRANRSKRGIGPEEYVRYNRSVHPLISDYKFWWLPLNSWYNCFNVGLTLPEPTQNDRFRAICELLQETGSAFLKENSVSLMDPLGTFFVDLELKVIGLTLHTNEDASYDYRSAGRVGNWNGDNSGWSPLSCRSYPINVPIGQTKSAGIRLRSIDSLLRIGRIDFIDFGLAGYSNGIWESLARTAPLVGLKGMVVFRAKEMLDVRHGRVIPEISGLVVHVSSIKHLREYGQAFPNLKFLCLCIPNGDLIAEIVTQGILAQHFPNLKGLAVVSDRLSTTADEIALREQPTIFFTNDFVPSRIEWVCLDGCLLSMQNMKRYDHFALRLRYKSPLRFDNVIRNRDVDVLFMCNGFAGGGARAIEIYEYFRAERYWRAAQ